VEGSGEYLSSYLDGPLALSITIIIAELILIIAVVAVNLSTIINNLLSESEKELLILKALGAEEHRIWLSYSSCFVLVVFISSAIGHMVGFTMVNFLSSKGITRLLGHTYSRCERFIPTLLNLNI
jgi:ABC-type lipoprotein release transport system permease subunit